MIYGGRRLLPRALALLALTSLLALSACQPQADTLGNFSFYKQAGQARLDGLNTPGPHHAGLEVASGSTGTDVFGLQEANRPPGMHTQVMQFRFRSRGFFDSEPAAHIDIGLAGAWHKDDPDTPDNEGLLVGRGIIIGNVSQAPSGCNAARVIEIESYYRRGNRLFDASCSPPLEENTWYQIALIAGDNGAVGYRLRDAQGRVLAQPLLSDTDAQSAADHGGWWIGHVFSNQHPHADWSIDFHDLRVYWLPDPTSKALLQALNP